MKRYIKSDMGIILDRITKLEWHTDNQRKTWFEAKEWIESLQLVRYNNKLVEFYTFGEGWRFPTIAELCTLFKRNKTHNVSKAFNFVGWWVWSGDNVTDTAAGIFHFANGFERVDDKNKNDSQGGYTFAVRNKPGTIKN